MCKRGDWERPFLQAWVFDKSCMYDLHDNACAEHDGLFREISEFCYVYLDACKNVLYHSIFAICYFVLICYYVLLDAGKPLFL